ncbi:uncharacterized protein LOC102461556 isoform X1 [Pelodiscus sinensis]|uniref:uncharacterized protein LOC102461556 isoform X1 n=1 Tax=Pelodiscus sinensis TaxID=13735 RepID=UPI003F6B1845
MAVHNLAMESNMLDDAFIPELSEATLAELNLGPEVGQASTLPAIPELLQEDGQDIPAGLLEEERMQKPVKKTKKAAFKSNNKEPDASNLEQPSMSKACLRQSEQGLKRVSNTMPGAGGKRRKGGSPNEPVPGNSIKTQKKGSVKGVNKKKPRDRDLKDSSQCIIELYDLSGRLRSVYADVCQLVEKKFPIRSVYADVCQLAEKKFPRLAFEMMQKQYYPGEIRNLVQKLINTRQEIENVENWLKERGGSVTNHES